MERAARRIEDALRRDLAKKMVFLAGPRQCGKTTLAKRLVAAEGGAYFNWDAAQDRKALLSDRLPSGASLWVLDEIHKYRLWRGYLKGLFDSHGEKHRILVTGSAKLEIYSHGGDSLQGRYFLHHLHPFTLSELEGAKHFAERTIEELGAGIEAGAARVPGRAQGTLLELFRLGGFPEPFLSRSEREADRWRLAYGSRLVREDIRDLEAIKDLDRMEVLFDRLAETVGSPLSINNLREDLELAFGTVKNWILAFERIYGVFRVPPFGFPRIKMIKKEPKLYFWDWGRVSDPGARFENLVAVHLLRLTHWVTDLHGKKCELRYMRTREGHELDFVILLQGKPWFAVEAKLDQREPDPAIRYFMERFPLRRAFQVSLTGSKDYERVLPGDRRIRVLPAAKWLMALP